MPEALSDALFRSLIDAFPPDEAYGSADFRRDAMPPPVAHFLSTALQHGLGIEADALYAARSSWFDYAHPDVQEAFDLLIDALRQHAQVPAKAWEETLAQATEQVVDYLVRPVDTLVAFIFDEKEALRTSTVLSRLEYFAPYPYLHDATRAYAEEKGLDEIERERFRTMLERVDQQMTEDLDATGWLDVLEPLFDLAERTSAASGVPSVLLQSFFDAKGAVKVRRRLEAEAEASGQAVLGRADLRRLLSDVLPSSASRSQAPAAPPEEAAAYDQPLPLWMRFQLQEQQARDAVTAPPAPAPQAEEAAPPPDSGAAVPLWMRFQQRSEGAPPMHAAASPPAPPKQPEQPARRQERVEKAPPGRREQPREKGPPGAQELPRREEPAVRQEPPRKQEPPKEEAPPKRPAQPLTEKPPLAEEPPRRQEPPAPQPKPARPAMRQPIDELTALERLVLGAFEPERRALFVEHLFAGSREDYEGTLRQLEAAPTWQRASSIIAQEVFRKHRVNIYSKPAVAFTNAVEARYDEETFTENR